MKSIKNLMMKSIKNYMMKSSKLFSIYLSIIDGYPDVDLPCKAKQCKKDNCIHKENPRQSGNTIGIR